MLALVVRGTAREALLDSYSIERRAVGDDMLEAAGRLTTVATLKNPAAQAVRRLVPVAGQRPVGSGDAPRFALFAEPGPDVEALVHRFAALLEPAPRPPVRPSSLCLARPDGYVAMSARRDETAAVACYLEGLATQPPQLRPAPAAPR